MALQDTLSRLHQRTSGNFSTLHTDRERIAFTNSVKQDLSLIIEQLNKVYFPIVRTLVSDEALTTGLAGTTVYTDLDASIASNEIFWDSTNNRARTLKETFDSILSLLTEFDNRLTEVQNVPPEVDLSDIEDSIEDLENAVTAINQSLGDLENTTMIGSEFIQVFNFNVAAISNPTPGSLVPSGSDMIYTTLEFNSTGTEAAYALLSIPRDLDGTLPSQAELHLYTTPITDTGATVKYSFQIYTHDTSIAEPEFEPLTHGNTIAPTWSALGEEFQLFHSTTDLEKLFILTTAISVDNASGLIPIKVVRETASADDTYTGTVALLGMKIDWWR